MEGDRLGPGRRAVGAVTNSRFYVTRLTPPSWETLRSRGTSICRHLRTQGVGSRAGGSRAAERSRGDKGSRAAHRKAGSLKSGCVFGCACMLCTCLSMCMHVWCVLTNETAHECYACGEHRVRTRVSEHSWLHGASAVFSSDQGWVCGAVGGGRTPLAALQAGPGPNWPEGSPSACATPGNGIAEPWTAQLGQPQPTCCPLLSPSLSLPRGRRGSSSPHHVSQKLRTFVRSGQQGE